MRESGGSEHCSRENVEVLTITEVTFHLKFFSVLAALALTGVLVYYSGGFDFSFLDSLLPKEGGETAQLFQPAKPKSLPKKHAKKRPPVSSSAEEFTFFETLSDPGLAKYVKLDGKIKDGGASEKNLESINVEEKAETPPPLKTSLAGEKPSHSDAENLPVAHVALTASADAGNSAGVREKYKFAVQAGSFRRFEWAAGLVKRLKGKGYPAYTLTFRPLESDEIWYRVYLGKYADRHEALQAVNKARAEEGLIPILVLNKE